jgi:hypothetical protein
LALANGVTLLLSLSLIAYLVFFEPNGVARFVSSRASTELSAIQAANVAGDVKAHAESLFDVALEGMRVSTLLAVEVIVVLFLFVALSILNLVWLRKVKTLTSDA